MYNTTDYKKTPGNFKDLSGKRFGRLTVIKRTAPAENVKEKQRAYWMCKCDCGNECIVLGRSLLKGDTKSCGCLQKKAMKKVNEKKLIIRDLTGQQFGKLTVQYRINKEEHGSRNVWHCICSCGNEKNILQNSLINQKVVSCGCQKAENSSKTVKKNLGLIENTCVSQILSDKVSVRSTTGVRGVSFNKRAGKYVAYVIFKRKHYHLGYYESLEGAAKARKSAEEKIHGQFLEWYAKEYPDRWRKMNKTISE